MKKEFLVTLTPINFDEIISTTEQAALSCYGVRGISNKGSLMHPEIKKGKEKAIFVKNKVNTFGVEIHLILADDVKITEALSEAQKVIKFRLDQAFPKLCSSVDVFGETVLINK